VSAEQQARQQRGRASDGTDRNALASQVLESVDIGTLQRDEMQYARMQGPGSLDGHRRVVRVLALVRKIGQIGVRDADIDVAAREKARVLHCATGHDGHHRHALFVLGYQVRDPLSQRIVGTPQARRADPQLLPRGAASRRDARATHKPQQTHRVVPPRPQFRPSQPRDRRGEDNRNTPSPRQADRLPGRSETPAPRAARRMGCDGTRHWN
jgi:hypothetical protein